jgi:hypothetical protein
LASRTAQQDATRRENQRLFCPPLAILAQEQKNTLEISGKLNRTADRRSLAHICHIGFMSPLEIEDLPFEVTLAKFERDGLDEDALAAKLEQASFADLVAIVKSLGF